MKSMVILALAVLAGCATSGGEAAKPTVPADNRSITQILDQYADAGWIGIRPGTYNITGPLICITPEQSDAADALVAELARRAAKAP